MHMYMHLPRLLEGQIRTRDRCGRATAQRNTVSETAQATYAYQLNAPPPLGRPDCQHPEITVPGYCANIIVYIPTSPTAVRISEVLL